MIEFLKKTRLNIPFLLKEWNMLTTIFIKENENITFDKLAECQAMCMRENATFTAPALAKSGYVYVSGNATFTAPALAKSGYVYVRETPPSPPRRWPRCPPLWRCERTPPSPPRRWRSPACVLRDNATFTAPALAKSGSVEVRENATFTAPALAKYGYVDVSEGAIFTAPALMAHKWLARTPITHHKKGTKMNERTPTPFRR